MLDLGIPLEPARRLRDAHPRPLVGVRDREEGSFRSFRVPARQAWSGRFEYLQAADAGRSYAAIALDCDDGGRLFDALIDWEIPPPSWVVWRAAPEGKRAHALWCLSAPVYKGEAARAKPLQCHARVAEWLAEKVGADPGYNGVLTRCPVYLRTDLHTRWGRTSPYPLSELLDWVPDGWRRPALSEPATAIGRNCRLFDDLRRWAYKPSNWSAGEEGILRAAQALNRGFASPLPDREIRATARSVSKWVARRIESKQWSQMSFAFLQQERGRRSGEARRARSALRDLAIRKRAAQGASQRRIAAEFGVGLATVWRALDRGR